MKTSRRVFLASCVFFWTITGGCMEPKGTKELKFYTLFPSSQTEFNEIETLLAHGMTGHAPRKEGEFPLERTGPFIPKITMPGLAEMIVTEQGKKDLGELGFEGVTFKQVHPSKVVQLDWDPAVSKPDESIQDFVDLIESRPNSEEATKAIGPLYLVVLDVGATVLRIEQIGMLNPHFQLVFEADSWNGHDFFRAGRPGRR